MKPFFKENIGSDHPLWVTTGQHVVDNFTQVLVYERSIADEDPYLRAHFFGMHAKIDAYLYVKNANEVANA